MSIDDELRSISGVMGAIRVLPDSEGATLDEQDLFGIFMYSGLADVLSVIPGIQKVVLIDVVLRRLSELDVLLRKSVTPNALVKRNTGETVLVKKSSSELALVRKSAPYTVER